MGVQGISVRTAAALAAALLAWPGVPAQAQPGDGLPRPSIFNTTEVASSTVAMFGKWTAVLRRMAGERDQDDACSPANVAPCRLVRMHAFLKVQEGQPARGQVDAVNRYFNQVPYLTDPANYGVPDYWATPAEHLSRKGDCEDYAIAKFMALRALGFANDAMRVMVVQDLNLRTPHAVLVVYLDGTPLVLDNQVRAVVPASAIRHYQPIYSINETRWWLHRPAAPRGTYGSAPPRLY